MQALAALDVEGLVRSLAFIWILASNFSFALLNSMPLQLGDSTGCRIRAPCCFGLDLQIASRARHEVAESLLDLVESVGVGINRQRRKPVEMTRTLLLKITYIVEPVYGIGMPMSQQQCVKGADTMARKEPDALFTHRLAGVYLPQLRASANQRYNSCA